MHYLLKSSSHANDASVLSLAFSPLFFVCANCSFYSWCLNSKRKDSEPGTKSLLSNAEMMAHHPTDPVEMRRINFQTPGTKRVPTQTPKHTLCICIIKYTSDCSSFDNEIFMQLILTSVKIMQTRLWKYSSASQPTCTWQLPVVSEIKMAAAQVVQSVLSHGWVITVWQNLIIFARPHSTCQAADKRIRTDRNYRNQSYRSWRSLSQVEWSGSYIRRCVVG